MMFIPKPPTAAELTRREFQLHYEAGARCFDDLDAEQRAELACHMLAEASAMEASEIFSETNEAHEFAFMFARAVITGNYDHFLDTLKTNTAYYYKDRIDERFESLGEYMRACEEENIEIERSSRFNRLAA